MSKSYSDLVQRVQGSNNARLCIPTYPGVFRRTINFKILQFNYFKKKRMDLFSFLKAQITSQGRSKLFNEWNLRGAETVSKYGIKLPDKFPQAYLNEVFADEVYSVEGFVPDSQSSILDIGAQYGDYSILCSKKYGVKKVDAFEPLIENISIFKELIALNGTSNIEVHECALSDVETSVEMGYNSQMLKTISTGPIKQIIKFRKLDSFRLRCDLLKIDVEGFEVKVILGGEETIQRYKPRIIIEVHSGRLRKLSINILERIGYRVAFEENHKLLNGDIGLVFFEPKN